MEKQVIEYASGNEMAAIAIKQIGYDFFQLCSLFQST